MGERCRRTEGAKGGMGTGNAEGRACREIEREPESEGGFDDKTNVGS